MARSLVLLESDIYQCSGLRCQSYSTGKRKCSHVPYFISLCSFKILDKENYRRVSGEVSRMNQYEGASLSSIVNQLLTSHVRLA